MKKEVEGRFAASVADRVELFMTGYHKLHNEVGRWAIRIDGKEVYQVGDCASWKYQYSSSEFGKTDDQTTKGMHDRDDLLRSLKE